MLWISSLAGALLIVVALADIYLTVLYPRSGRGFLSHRLYQVVWSLFRSARPPWAGKGWLSHCGPMLLVATVLMWTCILWCGFAFIYWPQLGNVIRSSEGTTSHEFTTALYFSGYNLTTLGTGDIVPKTDFYRLITVLEAMLGFSVITLALTYFMAVYSALIRRNSFAMGLHYRTAGTGDANRLLLGGLTSDDYSVLRQAFSAHALALADLCESHHSYPILHYFRFESPQYAMARMALLTLDSATLVRSALNQNHYKALVKASAVDELWGVGMQMLPELHKTLLPGDLSDEHDADEAQWRARYRRALRELRADGISTAEDEEASETRYVELRRQWQPYVRDFADYMDYEWSAIEPFMKEA